MTDVTRFLDAQAGTYDTALAEIRAGRKQSHWMWFILPQLKGLGRSGMADFYGIAAADEARAYLAHDILSARLLEMSQAVLAHPDKTAAAIFGETDALKLRSCMTLFSEIAPDTGVFQDVLAQKYGGQRCRLTLALLHRS